MPLRGVRRFFVYPQEVRVKTRLFLIGVALMCVTAPVSAQGATEPPTVPTLVDALRLLGTTVGAGMVISFLLTRVDWFKALTGDKRFQIVFGLSMLIPFAATLVTQLVPATVLIALEPYWQSLAAGFIVFIGSQAQYWLQNQKKP